MTEVDVYCKDGCLPGILFTRLISKAQATLVSINKLVPCDGRKMEKSSDDALQHSVTIQNYQLRGIVTALLTERN